ncbi:hypothetical protein B4U79_11347 [Dinothrombium tinctorium]|uniref:Uncharacterized protein n=1 Tax=Dinothrombium tinctorium TaxID=1965070 RepID=A0A3S3P948_9ACAR|nr:hypothetical protein B4U79_08125 [Dinothrombium tinctorium]RWS03812.1 hypothetical protein B4U79_11347 [Dinothrombium tinctorium]
MLWLPDAMQTEFQKWPPNASLFHCISHCHLSAICRLREM